MSIPPISSLSDWKSSLSNLSKLELENKMLEVDSMKPELSVLQTVKKNYNVVADYQTYRLGNGSPQCDEIVSSYTAELITKAMFQMKAHLFGPQDPIFITGFLGIFKLACDSIEIQTRFTREQLCGCRLM